MTAKGTPARLLGFVLERCLSLYPAYFLLFVCALESLTSAVTDPTARWLPTANTWLRVLAIIVTGAFLRMVDDQKDLDYDREHNPDRPLVAGRVSAGELRAAMIPTAVLALAIAGAISLPSALVLAAVHIYGLMLWWVETNVERVRRNAMTSLLVTYPIQFLIMAFIVIDLPSIREGKWGARVFAEPLVFAGAFLHLEFAKKTSRNPSDDAHSYARAIGFRASAVAAFALAALAVSVELALTAPWKLSALASVIGWLPLVIAVLPLGAAWTFFRSDRSAHPVKGPTLFLLLFYLAIILQGLVR